MKQTNLLKTFLLLCALIVGSTCAWADVSTLTFTSACGGSGTADDGTQWTVTSDGTESNYDSTKGIHYGTGSAQVTYITLSTNDISGTITKVVVNASTANGVSATVGVTIDGDAFGGDPQSLSSSATDYTFNGSASGEIVVTVTKPSKAAKALYVKSITVTYTTGSVTPTCATPTFDPAAGTYTSAQNVTISSTTEGATIYYTTNGEDPTTSSSVYSSAINVSTNTTIKAIAVKEGNDNSAVATATYQIVNIEHAGTEADPYTVADARTAIDANIGLTDVYATGIVSKIVNAWNTTYSNISFDISTNGSTTSDQLRAYRCTSSATADASTIKVGDIVVISGTLTKVGSIYEFGEGCKLVSLTPDPRTAPTLSWSASEVVIDKGAAESEYTLPTLNNPQNVAPIIYTITGTDNLANEEDGNISVNTNIEGSVIVQASFEGNATYKSAEASYTITVVDKNKKGSVYNPYTVAEVEEQESATSFGNNIYVTGYIVGCVKDNKCYKTTTDKLVNTNLLLADTPDISFTEGVSVASSTDGMIPIELPNALRTNWGITTNDVLGYKVLLKGNAQSYFSTKGIKSTSEITAVSIPVTVTAAGWATYVTPCNLEFAEGDAFVVSAATASTATLAPVTKIGANKAVLLKGEGVKTATVLNEVPAAVANELAISTGGEIDGFVLAKKNDKVGFYKWAGGSLTSGKVYLPAPAGARDYLEFSFDETTALTLVNSEKRTVNSDIYNLAGQRVAQPTKGLYIVNGKKVVIK